MPDDPLITALEVAIEAAPERVGLRVELARALLEKGDPEAALLHARAALARSPADAGALAVAAQAAGAQGMTDVAEGYGRLADSLATPGPSPVPQIWAPGEGEAPGAEPEAREPAVRLADVGGMQEVKRRLELSFLAPIRDPSLRDYYGDSVQGGLLLFGPPGCGKTFLARALAGELDAGFVAVGLPDILSGYLGESEERLHEMFERARASAPCVLFLDEIDAIGHKRSQLRGSAGRTLVNQLLSEMDGVDSQNEGVFVLAATNHPWDVDSALRRPGRFDRTVLVLPPDREARKVILARSLRGRPAGDIDLDAIAGATELYSGADLVLVVRTAAEFALEDALRGGERREIVTADLRRALKEVRPSTRAWFGTAHSYAAFSNEGGELDELLAFIRRHKLS